MRKTVVGFLSCFVFSSLILSKCCLQKSYYSMIRVIFVFPAGANSIVTADFAESSPFYEWPGNETLSPENTTVYLRCTVRNCENGPRLVIAGVRGPNCSFEATQCLKTTDQTFQDGIMIVEKAITLSWIKEYRNTCQLESLPIPVWCEIGQDKHEIGYIHVNDKDQQQTAVTSEETSPQTVVSPCACSVTQGTNLASKLTYIDVCLVVMACIITFVVNR